MALAHAAGYLLVGCGPWCAVFALVAGKSSFLVLLTFAAAFYHLTVLLLCALPWRPFLPLPATAGAYVAPILLSGLVKEACRYALYRVFRRGVSALEAEVSSGRLAEQAALSGYKVRRHLDAADYLSMSLAVGQGYGLSHYFFFFLSVVYLSIGDGTWYVEPCTEMSLFLVLALLSLAMAMVHGATTVVAFHRGYGSGWEGTGGDGGRSVAHVAAAVACEVSCSLVMLVNFQRGGCVAGVPMALAVGVGTVAWALCEARGVLRRGAPAAL